MTVETFGVLVEVSDDGRQTPRLVFITGLTSDRLVKEVIVPYEQGGSLILDGHKIPSESIGRAKIVRIPNNLDEPFRSIRISPGGALQSEIAQAASF